MSAKRSGLGRGLDALLPKADRGVQNVSIDALRVSPFQPRRTIDEGAIEDLSRSVAEKGVLQPLLVRPLEGGYEIVAGERRFRAAQRCGLTTVPVIVRNLDDRETLEIAIIENVQRADLTPLEEGRAYARLLELGATQEEVAKAVGKSRSAVANTLRLLQLPEGALAALEAGSITAGHARAILAQPEEHRAWALGEIVRRGLSVREAEALKPPRNEPHLPADGKGKGGSQRYEALATDLARHVGTKVRISGDKRGKLELHFFSEDELQRLLELLGYQP